MRKSALFGMLAASVSASAAIYADHDGVTENSVGLTEGGNLAWIQAFQVSGGYNIITAIRTAFGTPRFPGFAGVLPGTPFNVHVWTLTSPTGDLTVGSTHLGAWGGTVAAGSIDTDVLQFVEVDATVGMNGSWFAIGVDISHISGFPAPWDESDPISGNAWVAASGTAGGFDPNNLAGGIGLFRMADVVGHGDWLLEAEAGAGPIPEPATIVVIGLGLAALAARRRRK